MNNSLLYIAIPGRDATEHEVPAGVARWIELLLRSYDIIKDQLDGWNKSDPELMKMAIFKSAYIDPLGLMEQLLTHVVPCVCGQCEKPDVDKSLCSASLNVSTVAAAMLAGSAYAMREGLIDDFCTYDDIDQMTLIDMA